MGEHRDDAGSDFVRRHNIKMLVWCEEHSDIYEAISHEKRIKRWKRDFKLALIEDMNPEWEDLFEMLHL